MSARERLRRYLEQRREMGESELVLDGMTVEEVLRLVGMPASSPPRPASNDDKPAIDDDRLIPQESSGQDTHAQMPASASLEAPRQPSTVEKDWRATLRKAEAGHQSDYNNGKETLHDIAREVSSCTRCPLYSSALNPVPGEGNPDADFVCVGEAPGQNEDQQGRPFVGAAGDLLGKIIGAIELRREDIFICNVIKHRPPGNRDPLPDEVLACQPYLERQLDIIKPKVILALGRFAAQTLLNTTLPIGKLRGEVHQYRGIPLIVTYHPAALLRNASWKRPTWEDVQLARRVLDASRLKDSQ